ncbi:MAG: hypothetical protein B9S32_12430 [Verrucomicrobia bacterium Tous-C9LFEB]|nr:MAG: hypothetical protein B9S32_12430 [Verrucomicrobia bacterium Tous-C9LFEB]
MNEFIKKYGKIGLCFLGVFLAGAVTGGVISAGIVRRVVAHRTNPQNWEPLLMRAMDRKLDLRPEQRAKIVPMVASAANEFKATRADAVAHHQQTLAQLKANLATVLDPEQQKALEKLSQERQQRWKKFLQE